MPWPWLILSCEWPTALPLIPQIPDMAIITCLFQARKAHSLLQLCDLGPVTECLSLLPEKRTHLCFSRLVKAIVDNLKFQAVLYFYLELFLMCFGEADGRHRNSYGLRQQASPRLNITCLFCSPLPMPSFRDRNFRLFLWTLKGLTGLTISKKATADLGESYWFCCFCLDLGVYVKLPTLSLCSFLLVLRFQHFHSGFRPA